MWMLLNGSVKGRKQMKFVSLLSFALAMGLSVANSPASAAVKDTSSSREAVILKCNAQAKSHYPGSYRDWDQTRAFAYQSCMHDAGQPM
jgi:hypothetical protein